MLRPKITKEGCHFGGTNEAIRLLPQKEKYRFNYSLHSPEQSKRMHVESFIDKLKSVQSKYRLGEGFDKPKYIDCSL
jgi:hypothetical protein